MGVVRQCVVVTMRRIVINCRINKKYVDYGLVNSIVVKLFFSGLLRDFHGTYR